VAFRLGRDFRVLDSSAFYQLLIVPSSSRVLKTNFRKDLQSLLFSKAKLRPLMLHSKYFEEIDHDVGALGVECIPSVAYRLPTPQIPHLHTTSYGSSLFDKPDKTSALVRMDQFLSRFSESRGKVPEMGEWTCPRSDVEVMYLYQAIPRFFSLPKSYHYCEPFSTKPRHHINSNRKDGSRSYTKDI
jgi:hypothetical protein